MKIYNTQIVFREIPDKVSLALNISNCPNNCEGCHSPHLREDLGRVLDNKYLDELLQQNEGITCVLFLGGDGCVDEVKRWANYIHAINPQMRTAWYSGNDYIDITLVRGTFDYIKFGHYDERYGPLNSPTTNQVLLKYDRGLLYNITKDVR